MTPKKRFCFVCDSLPHSWITAFVYSNINVFNTLLHWSFFIPFVIGGVAALIQDYTLGLVACFLFIPFVLLAAIEFIALLSKNSTIRQRCDALGINHEEYYVLSKSFNYE